MKTFKVTIEFDDTTKFNESTWYRVRCMLEDTVGKLYNTVPENCLVTLKTDPQVDNKKFWG